MSLRDRLRRKPDPRSPEQVRELAFELLALNHLVDFLGHKTRPEWKEAGRRTYGQVKLIPADYPTNSEPAVVEFSAYADPKQDGRVSVTVETPSGHLCSVGYQWEGEPEQAVLSRHSIYNVTDWRVSQAVADRHERSPEPSDLENMIRERLYVERAAYLAAHPDERPALGPLDVAVTTAVVGQPAEPDISR